MDYSSKTINQEASSRNQYHFETFAKVKELLGERPLVMDREFSYLELMENLVLEGIHFVIRLKVGAKFTDQEGKLVALSIAKGETRILNKVFYMGKVFMNVIGVWREGFSQPMWVMTDLSAEDGLTIYLQRMKIEESFRDMKSLLGLERLMNKRRDHMEKMVALLLIALPLVSGWATYYEKLCFQMTGPKKKLYSGLFVLLKLKFNLSPPKHTRASTLALTSFGSLVLAVRSEHVVDGFRQRDQAVDEQNFVIAPAIEARHFLHHHPHCCDTGYLPRDRRRCTKDETGAVFQQHL